MLLELLLGVVLYFVAIYFMYVAVSGGGCSSGTC